MQDEAFARLNWPGLRIPGGRDVGRRIVERFAGFIGQFFVLRANFPYDVMPAVVPADASLSINQNPRAVALAVRLLGLAVGSECDIEIAAFSAHAHFPLAHEVVPAG